MEIPLPPDLESHLAAIAASAGRTAAEVVQEAVILWEERENARVLAEFCATLDEAEASVERGDGLEITQESMRTLAEEVKQRGRARVAGEKQAPR